MCGQWSKYMSVCARVCANEVSTADFFYSLRISPIALSQAHLQNMLAGIHARKYTLTHTRHMHARHTGPPLSTSESAVCVCVVCM